MKESKAQWDWMGLSFHGDKEVARSSKECSFKLPVLGGEREDHLRASCLRCALSHGTVVSVQHVLVMMRETTVFLCLQVGYSLLQEVWLQLA